MKVIVQRATLGPYQLMETVFDLDICNENSLFAAC